MKKILLLDIENVTVKADEIFAFCQKYDRVYVSFAKTPAIFALQDIELLSKLLNYKLFLITMTENKKSNGADFGLAFYARVLSGQFKPNKTKFYILSSDRDFEHIARLLQKKSFKVKQVTKEQYIMHKILTMDLCQN
ncbi:PIN domain-containing protein [Moraxella bovis]|uniref:PIN domain-containing protein n=1 Tax=Moraxella bovis TaxID=476 RepID=UPI0022274CDA|nr:PIN domain-containing protein [Moraxella bovis]UZA31061.1 PIN domain-containing protein [Moraxella bovis]